MRLVSIQVGKPAARGDEAAPDWLHKRWTTGYGKAPALGPVFLGSLNLAGDGQHDKRWHGGPDMAVLAYAASHYGRWRDDLSLALPNGAFAENFTVEGADEETACIGDVWQVGEARLQISEPRKPCSNISRFWGREDLLKRVEQTGRFGWYLRVLQEGNVAAGAEIALASRPHPEWTVARAMQARLRKSKDRPTALLLAACPALGADWREKLLEQK